MGILCTFVAFCVLPREVGVCNNINERGCAAKIMDKGWLRKGNYTVNRLRIIFGRAAHLKLKR